MQNKMTSVHDDEQNSENQDYHGHRRHQQPRKSRDNASLMMRLSFCFYIVVITVLDHPIAGVTAMNDNRRYDYEESIIMTDDGAPTTTSTSSSTASTITCSLNFLGIGDWGGVGAFPLPNIHTNQKQVASGMANVARNKTSYQFILSMGDNFYLLGTTLSTITKRYQQTFSNVYSDATLKEIPWYVIGGNHDHYGDIQSQINYTFSKENNYDIDNINDDDNYNLLNIARRENILHENSEGPPPQQQQQQQQRRWNFPSLYHSKVFTKNCNNDDDDDAGQSSIKVGVIMIDTVDLASMIIPSLRSLFGGDETLPLRSKEDASNAGKQWRWIEEQLATMTEQENVDYLLVVGHYPIYSVGHHGSTETLIKYLQPLLVKYNAHYISGHEHGMMHFIENITSSSTGGGNNIDTTTTAANQQIIHYMVNGAGNTCCTKRSNNKNKLPTQNNHSSNLSLEFTMLNDDNEKRKKNGETKVIGGFLSFEATNILYMNVKYHDHNGSVLYKTEIKSRKGSSE